MLLLLCGFALGAREPSAGEDWPEARRGKEIYLRGAGSAVALVGEDRMEVPASLLPCVSCHGDEGEGRPEGGVTPSDIRWSTLTKPYGIVRPSGRTHPAYDRETLARAIMEGLDPAGQPLLAAMPRYRLSRPDLQDLLVFLGGLGTYRDPGIAEYAIRVGTLVPSAGPGAETAEQMRAVLAAVFEQANARGGVFNRRIELRALSPSGSSEAELRRQMEREGVFALVGGVLPRGSGQEVSPLEAGEIPLVGPWAPPPEAGSRPGRFVFYLFPGAREQSAALVVFASQERLRAGSRAMVLHADTAEERALAQAVAERCEQAGWNGALRVEYPSTGLPGSEVARRGLREGVADVFLLGNGAELKALLHGASGVGWVPHVFALGTDTARGALEAPAVFRDRLFLAFPTMPVPPASDGSRELFALLEAGKMPPAHRAAQVWAYAAAQVLLEGLRASGRQLSRERLVSALEGLYRLQTGVTAPITYGPGRRVGAAGACIVKVDPLARAFVPARDWVAVER